LKRRATRIDWRSAHGANWPTPAPLGPRRKPAECLQKLGRMTHCEHIRCLRGTDFGLGSYARAESTPACGWSIRGFGVDGHDFIASKLDPVAA